MKWKPFILGLGVGIVGAFVTKELYDSSQKISSDRALKLAKDHFKQAGPISGSWINMNHEPYEMDDIQYEVYKGGISRAADDTIEQYEFIVDANSGTVILTAPII